MPLPFALRSICMIPVLALGAGSALAQADDGAAERAAAVAEALEALRSLSEPAMDMVEADADADAAEVEADAAEVEDPGAEDRAAAVAQALDAFETLAETSRARAEAEAAETAQAAERAAAVDDALSAFEALAAETAARAEAEAQAAAEAEAEAARVALAEEAAAAAAAAVAAQAAAEAEAAAAREASLAEARAAIQALAEERAAAARAAAEVAAAAQAALVQCLEIAGEPSAENFPTEQAQRDALAALREALPACRAAAEALPEEGAPFFHMATAAQAAGRHRQAVPLYETAAENGVAAALTRLGDYHNFGLRPVREDVDQAVNFYRQAAEAGDPAGMATLAFMYRLGRGVPRDAAQMVALMEQAAAAGYPFAQYNLARTWLTGDGVAGGADAALGIPDPSRAVPLLVPLAQSGNVDAIQDLVALYSGEIGGLPANDFLRGGWVEQLAATGDPAGIAARGFLYEQGIGRPANPQRAAADYVAALETGEVDIDDLRGSVDGRVPPWERETAIAFQTILADRGLYTMAIDGAVGPGTRAAARGLSD